MSFIFQKKPRKTCVIRVFVVNRKKNMIPSIEPPFRPEIEQLSKGGSREINQTRRRAHKPSFPIIKVERRTSIASRAETAVSKAHGATSVLLNFTDFPSPLYRFIYYRPVARIISISVKQRGIVERIYERFT